jgi:hypothetical protein
MPDIIAINAAMTGVLNGIKLVRSAADATQEGREHIMELTNKMLDLQMLTNELINENARLEQLIRDLNKKLEYKGRVEIRDNSAWLPDEKEGNNGPYCASCWGNKHKLIPLVRTKVINKGPLLRCGVCKQEIR